MDSTVSSAEDLIAVTELISSIADLEPIAGTLMESGTSTAHS